MILKALSDFEDLPQRRLMVARILSAVGDRKWGYAGKGALPELRTRADNHAERLKGTRKGPRRATACAASLHRVERHAAGRVPLNVFT